MRYLLLILAPLASGCFFPTPLLPPTPVPQGRTHVDGALGLGAGIVTADAQVRHGLSGGREVNARAALSPEGLAGAVGVGIMQRLTPEASSFAVSAHLGVSGMMTVSEFDTDTGFFVHPALIVGREDIYGGARASLGRINDDNTLFAGPFVGTRFGDTFFVGAEIGVMLWAQQDSFVPTATGFETQTDIALVLAPSITFGLQPDRTRETIPAVPQAELDALPPEASGAEGE